MPTTTRKTTATDTDAEKATTRAQEVDEAAQEGPPEPGSLADLAARVARLERFLL